MVSYYHHFIKNCSKIAKPLTDLTKKGQRYDWTSECEIAFQTLKQHLTTAPVLSLPDFSQSFIIQTDASDAGLRCVLSQIKDGNKHPIAFSSHTLNKAEKNYSTTEKEALAVVFAVKIFLPYLIGPAITIIETDYAPLFGLFKK